MDDWQKQHEEREREREKRLQLSRAKISELTTELEDTLKNPGPGIDRLERQSDLLDQLLYTLLKSNLQNDKANGYLNVEAINLALRVQKQSMETQKARAAVDYMQHMSGLKACKYVYDDPYAKIEQDTLPPPPQNDERTE